MRPLIVTCLLFALVCARPAAAGPHEDADAAYARGDYPAALAIYRELAAQGVAPAQFNLGVMHDFGQGVDPDPVAAVRWYREAAAQGHGGAQFNLGGMYFEGMAVAAAATVLFPRFLPVAATLVDATQAQSIEPRDAVVGVEGLPAASFTLGARLKVNPFRPSGMPLPAVAATATETTQLDAFAGNALQSEPIGGNPPASVSNTQ